MEEAAVQKFYAPYGGNCLGKVIFLLMQENKLYGIKSSVSFT
jgi:hypothetical protein